MTIEEFDDLYYNKLIKAEEVQNNLKLYEERAEKLGFDNPREEAEEVYKMIILSLYDIENEKGRPITDEIMNELERESIFYLIKKRLTECGMV